MVSAAIAAAMMFSACGSSGDDTSGGSAGGGSSPACPSEIRGAETYSYDGNDPDCQAIVDVFNQSAADKVLISGDTMAAGSSTEKCDGGELTTTYDACEAHQEGTCSGLNLVGDCVLHKSGTFTCDYTLRRQSDALVCMFTKTIK